MRLDNIKVSICCITYNHEKYIAEAIESFLSQKVNFDIEIIIHDDASTDKTPEIIESYREKYPKIIKPIYQKKNKYSKCKRIYSKYVWPKATGEYIALCEGDDYWIDNYKLQKQVDYLDNNKDVSSCIHGSNVINYGETRKEFKVIQHCDENKRINIEEMILLGPGFFATSSLIFRRDYINELPNFYYKSSVGDFPLILILGSKGSCYYINEIMSAYRFQIPNSWSYSAYKSDNKEKEIKNWESDIFILKEFNKFTNMKYKKLINSKLIDKYVDIDNAKNKKIDLNSKIYKELLVDLTAKKKLKFILKYKYKYIYMILIKLKRTGI